jgi:hypothetical protein
MDPIAIARKAPLLELPLLESPQATGAILEIARVATAGDFAWLETTDGQVLRLPDSLYGWARTTVAVALSMANPFPAKVEFGVVGGRAYAEVF